MTRMQQLLAVVAILGLNDAWLLGVGAPPPSLTRTTQIAQPGYQWLDCSKHGCSYTVMPTPTPTALPDPSPTPTPVPAPTPTSSNYLPEGDG